MKNLKVLQRLPKKSNISTKKTIEIIDNDDNEQLKNLEVENNCSPQKEVLSEPKYVITATKKNNKNNMAEVSISSRNVKFASDEDESLKKGILKCGKKKLGSHFEKRLIYVPFFKNKRLIKNEN